MCREPIIVMGVSGGVQLTCRDCAKKDPKLISIEAVTSDRDKYRTKYNELLHDENSAREQFATLQRSFDHAITQQVDAVQQENLELTEKLNHKEESTLTDRLKAKMRLKYGETDQEKFVDFAIWLKDERRWSTSEDVNIPDLVRYYFHIGEDTDG